MSTASKQTNPVVIVLLVLGGMAFLGILVIGLFCGGMYFYVSRTVQPALASAMTVVAEQVSGQLIAQNFLNDLQNGDTAGAYEQTSQLFQRQQTLEQFQAFLDRNPKLKNHQGTALNSQPGGRTGTLTYQVTVFLAGGGTVSATLDLVKEGTEWKVNRFTLPPGNPPGPPNQAKEIDP